MLKYNIEALHIALQSFKGKPVWITESVSRNRRMGHNSQFATSVGFIMTLKSVKWSFSGANLVLIGTEGFTYSLSSEHIVRFNAMESGRLSIVEQYESKTERETTLWLAVLPMGK